jgi:hypothetical protein
MEQISSEPFVAGIILVGIAVMLRILRLRAAFFIIGIIALAFALTPSAGKYSQHIPTWLFVIIVIILGINLLKSGLGILFGKEAADSFTGKFLYGIFTPIFNAIGAILRTIFRIK